jgi:hypothetical protein
MRAGAVAVLLLLSAPVRAEGWQAHDGAPCPAFAAGRWFNTDGARPTAASLKGQVFLLVFFGGT